MDKQSIKINWTRNAASDYNRIVIYLIENWSEKVALNFTLIVQDKLKVLSDFSTIGRESKKIKGVRSILITKHNCLYYRIKKDSIEILNILDTRQNPTKNPY